MYARDSNPPITLQNLDKSLDDIITVKKKSRSRPTGPRRAQSAGNGAQQQQGGAKVQQQRAQPQQQQQVAAPKPLFPQGDKIIVSNLPDDVNEQQIKVSLTLLTRPCVWVRQGLAQLRAGR